MSTILVEKYRPNTLDELISHEHIVKSFKNSITGNKILHLLLYGPPGVGKTSSILAMAKEFYGKNYNHMVLELNGSDDRGINVVREVIKEFAKSKRNIPNKVKLIILDEADAMTYDAQFALRRIIEIYTESTRFCLICNFATKIIPALQSRCLLFKFNPLDMDIMFKRIKEICDLENMVYDDEALYDIIKISEGDMRKSLNILQTIHVGYPKITSENVFKLCRKPTPTQINEMIDIILTKDINTSYNYIVNMNFILKDIIYYIPFILPKKVGKFNFTEKNLAKVLICLANIEKRLQNEENERFRIGSLIASFIL